MKRILSLRLIACTVLLVTMLPVGAADFATGAAVHPVPLPPGYPRAAGLSLTVNGTPVPILQIQLSRRHHETYETAIFTFSGSAQIELSMDKSAGPATILPTGYGVTPAVSGNSIHFELNRPRHLYIQIPGRNPLLLFADGPPTMPEPTPGPATFDVVAGYHADPTGKVEATAAIQKAIDDAAVRGGTVLIPKGVFRSNKLTLKSNVRLHLTGGAALKFVDVVGEGFVFNKRQGAGLYFLTVDNARNVSVTGQGLLDCNGETVRGSDKARKLVSAFHSAQVTGLTLEGITIMDSSSWTVVPAFSRQVLIRNIKIVNTLTLYENDGIDPLGCQDVLVDHCFVLATDDAFCPKPGGVGTHGGGAKPGPAMDLRDVMFNDCVAWTRAAGFKLGRQSSVPALNVVCKNSHILACSRACVIDHDGGNAPFRNILFQDITIESGPKSTAVYVETQDPGPTREVTYERLAINLEKLPALKFGGKNEANTVSDIRFIDCTALGKPVTAAGTPLRVAANKFVRPPKFLYREPAKRGPALTLTAVWGTHLVSAPAGAPVPVKPAVLVTDRENQPLPGVEVVFAVESGNGNITQATAQTDAKGIATLGSWTLGKDPGVNTLTARSKNAIASHVVFQTTGTSAK